MSSLLRVILGLERMMMMMMMSELRRLFQQDLRRWSLSLVFVVSCVSTQ